MAPLCKNCGHALVFNPKSQLLECGACGGAFRPEAVQADAKEYREDLKAEAANEVYNSDEEKLMDCYVYSCSECGGEIIINGTEASTTCIYCGNPNVVFSRIAKQKRPEFIMPFSVTREQAVSFARRKISRGAFVPKAIKNFSVDCCRGIYLPYWLVNGTYYDTVIISGQVREDDHRVVKYFGRSGHLDFKELPVDASTALSDDSSSKLEPFDMSHLKPFDEDYLAGFYSNVSDVTYKDIRKAATERGKEFFSEEVLKTVVATSKRVVDTCPSVDVDRDMKYVMLPAWFITFDYKGKHHTILVNGDTGKVVCALPWKKALFYGILCAIGIGAAVASFFIFWGLLRALFEDPDSGSVGNGVKILFLIIGGIVTLFGTGIRRVMRVMENISLTQDKAMFNFTKRRQG